MTDSAMLNLQQNPGPAETVSDGSVLRLSDGEVHFLWWFIQGGIMRPAIRRRLRKGWGMCERHAWGWISAEAAFRKGYMHGPAVLYKDLMNRAKAAFTIRGPLQEWRTLRTVRTRGPCLMCNMKYHSRSRGFMKAERALIGRDLNALQDLAVKTAAYWEKALCGRCAGTDSPQRCRKHLVEELSRGEITDLSPHVSLVNHIEAHMRMYNRSFCHGYHGTDTDEDRAALISAVGWCSGWKTLLSIVEEA